MTNTHPSKVLKYCPFCGSPNFIWDGIKAHHCEDCKQRLYTNEAGAVIALIENDKNEILCTIRKFDPAKGKLDLPGGFIDIGETAEHAVVREIKEELNLDIEHIQFYCTFPNTYTFKNLTYFTIDIVFRCTVKKLDTLHVGDDVANYVFKNPHEISLDEIGLNSVKQLIQTIQNKKGGM